MIWKLDRVPGNYDPRDFLEKIQCLQEHASSVFLILHTCSEFTSLVISYDTHLERRTKARDLIKTYCRIMWSSAII